MNPFYLFISSVVVLDLAAVLLAKLWSIHRSPWFMVGSVVCFALIGVSFPLSLKFEGMALANIMWVAFSAIVIALIGYFFFKEVIAPIQIVGILIIVVGLVFVNLK